MTGRARAFVALLWLLGVCGIARAQDMEPRAYANAPIGLNFLLAGYAYTRGGASFDPALPVTDPDLETSSLVLGYGHVFDLWGQSAKLNVVVPYTFLSGHAHFAGRPMEREVSGFATPIVKLSVNLHGAPALSLKDYASYRQDLIIGASLRVGAPWGQYDDTKAVNLASNRWSFKPEIGVSKALGRWIVEGAAGVTFYTDNKDYFNGNTRSQDPVYSAEGHAIYSFNRGVWGSLDLTYFTGGRTTVNGVVNHDLQQNWRLGGTLSMPLGVQDSIKLYASSGVSARTGNNYDLLGIAWQHRWGGGL